MANHAHSIPTPDVHPLAGSSPPGAGAPGFDPVTTDEDDNLAARIEPDLSRFCAEDQVLIQTAKRLISSVRTGPDNGEVRAMISTLAALKPRSLIALGMKSDACVDVLTHLNDPAAVRNIGLSIWRDAMDLAVASVCPPEITPEAPQESWFFRDAAFRWATAEVECDGWYQMMTNIEKLVIDRGIPDALWVKPEDKEIFPGAHRMPDFDEKPWFGHPDTIVALRATIEKGNSGPADRAARRLEILDTYDVWSRKSDNTRLVLAAADAFKRSMEEGARIDDLEKLVMRAPITTLDGLIVKAVVGASFRSDVWGNLGYVERVIENAEDDEKTEPRDADYLHRDLLRLACSRGISKETLAGNQPKDVPAPTRELLEGYRTWLHFELRFLNNEMGIRGADRLAFMLDSSAGRFHGNDEPPPSTRAAAVLGMFGLMPAASPVEQPVVEVAA